MTSLTTQLKDFKMLTLRYVRVLLDRATCIFHTDIDSHKSSKS